MSSSSIHASPPRARRRRQILVAPLEILDRGFDIRELKLQAGDCLFQPRFSTLQIGSA
jgi:hypothetical protein